jgi:phosphomannomutase
MGAAAGIPLEALVADLLARLGPAHYARHDMRLARPVSKERMVERLVAQAPQAIGGLAVVSVNTLDGVKYLMEDDSWLLIRPSGTEPVLRVYAEAREPETVEALIAYGRTLAEA